MLSTRLQAESDVLRKRSTAAPWPIIAFQYSSFKPLSRLSPSANSESLSHIVVARMTFFALLEPVSSSNMWRFCCGFADIRGSVIRCTYTIPDSSIRFLYLRRCGYQDSIGSKGLTRRTFFLAICQSAREFARQSFSYRQILVCLRERCGIRIARGPELSTV